jgi:hypothetical protein
MDVRVREWSPVLEVGRPGAGRWHAWCARRAALAAAAAPV